MNKPFFYISAFSLVLGCIVTVGMLSSQKTELPQTETGRMATAEYGEHIIRNTALALGSGQKNPEHRLSGNNLDCASCHLESGQKQGTLSLMQAAAKYPRFSGRDGIVGDLADRINGCMQRSMNGKPLLTDSVEMLAMVAYIEQLGRQDQAMGESSRMVDEPVDFVEPQRRADLDNGARVYVDRCRICHGENGEGLPASGGLAEGYVFPPLWGPDSYNIGAGMARLLTAARFIKARMPLGSADLNHDDAYDVAAYINAQERPAMANLELDYPELSNKPVDSPYPPYADPFSQEQHMLGPYAPIREYYEAN